MTRHVFNHIVMITF